jgi:hypothetical protein
MGRPTAAPLMNWPAVKFMTCMFQGRKAARPIAWLTSAIIVWSFTPSREILIFGARPCFMPACIMKNDP